MGGYSSIQVVTAKCMTEPYPTNCRFPFTYNGETYDECTKVDNWGVPWCSTDPNGDGDCTDCTWANCEVPKECKFPTTYQGKSCNKCTFVDNDGYPWCNTTDGGWGNCDRSLCEVEKNELIGKRIFQAQTTEFFKISTKQRQEDRYRCHGSI